MANKISVIIDATVDKAVSSFKNFKSSVDEAEGVTGKFKAGASSAFESISQNAGALAISGGAALVGFGVKAVGAFTDTAKAALDLGTATGLSTEDASRWIAVADDMGVSAESLQSGLGKIAKTLDSGKWEKYGVATRDAGGNARDTNDILLDSFDKLGKITNETERARVGNDLFGKGYASLAPLIGKTRGEMEDYLGSVEKGQVITGEEADKAEKMRLAQDTLSDAIKEVTLAFGQELTGLAPLLVGLSKLIGLATEAASSFGGGGGMHDQMTKVGNALEKMGPQLEASGHGIDYWQEQLLNGKMSADEIIKAVKAFDGAAINATTSTQGYSYAVQDVAKAQAEATAKLDDSTTSTEGYSYAVQDVAQSTHEAALEAWELEKATKDAKVATDGYKRAAQMMADDVKRDLDQVKGKWDEMTGNITDDQSLVNLQGSFDEVKAKAIEAFDAAKHHSKDAEEKIRDHQLAADDLKLSVINYGKEILGLPPERVTKMLAEIDAGNLAAVEAQLNALTRNRTMNVDIVTRGGAGYGGLTGARASGGPVAAGGTYLVGEHGPERVLMGGDGTVMNAADTAAAAAASDGGGGVVIQSLTINMPVGSDGNAIIAKIQQFERRNGPGWRS